MKVNREYFLVSNRKTALFITQTVLRGKILDYKLVKLLFWHQLSFTIYATDVLLLFLREKMFLFV